MVAFAETAKGNPFMNKLFAAAALAALTVSPAFAQKTPKALQEAFSAAVVAEDASALAALYAADAVSYGPDGTTAVGRDEIAASWAPFFDSYDGFAIELKQAGERAVGETHAAWGTFTMSATPVGGGEPEVWMGRFTDVSEKTRDGWLYVVDHASMVAPPADE